MASSLVPPPVDDAEPPQFGLGLLFLVVMLMACIFAVGRMLPPEGFVGLCGGAALVCLLAEPLLVRLSLLLKVLFWVLLASYMLASGVAHFAGR